MILGLILGNTSVRYAVFDQASIFTRGRIEWKDLEARGAEIAAAGAKYPVREVVAASVRDDLLGDLKKWTPSSLGPWVLARRDFRLPIENRYLRPEEAGTDRLLNALAARGRSQGTGAVVVDFGTALSLSVVSPDGAFVGGLIAAGGGAILRGLEASTPRLPRIQLEAPGRLPAEDTASALRAGIYWEVVGVVRAMVQGLLRDLPWRPRLLATGGEAELFAAGIPEIHEVVPDLILEGLQIACRSRSAK